MTPLCSRLPQCVRPPCQTDPARCGRGNRLSFFFFPPTIPFASMAHCPEAFCCRGLSARAAPLPRPLRSQAHDPPAVALP